MRFLRTRLPARPLDVDVVVVGSGAVAASRAGARTLLALSLRRVGHGYPLSVGEAAEDVL